MKLNIYFIKAEPIWPVGNAGAVVIAETPEKAFAMSNDLYNAEPPILLGQANASYDKPQIIFSNNGDY